MTRNGVRTGWAALVLSIFLVTAVAVSGVDMVHVSGQALETTSDHRRPLTVEEGLRVAEAALAFAELEYVSGDTVLRGMPYLWGGRTTVTEFSSAVEGADRAAMTEQQVVPATASTASDADPAPKAEAALSGLGVDASGVAVNALRSLGIGLRFAASGGDEPVWWADATSAVLYDFNVVAVPPEELRAGDLVFFGRTLDGDIYVSGVGVVTGRTGTRVDFVVASAREDRVIHTFARTDGDYWQGNIVGAGRFLVRD